MHTKRFLCRGNSRTTGEHTDPSQARQIGPLTCPRSHGVNRKILHASPLSKNLQNDRVAQLPRSLLESCPVKFPELTQKLLPSERLSIWWGRQTIRKLFPPNTAWARFFQKLHSPWTMRKSFQMYHGECFLDVGSPWWLNPSWGQLREFRLNRKMRCACTWQEAWWQVSKLRNGAGEQEHRRLVTWTAAGTTCTRLAAAQVLKSQGSGWIFEQSTMLQLPSPNYTPIKNKYKEKKSPVNLQDLSHHRLEAVTEAALPTQFIRPQNYCPDPRRETFSTSQPKLGVGVGS